MTRIIHIISDSNIGGAGRCLVNYLRYRDRSRFDVSVILPRGSLLIPEVAALNVPYFEVDGIAERSFSPEAIGTLVTLLRREKPAIIHTHGSFSGRIAAKLCGCRIVYTRHSAFPVPDRLKRGLGHWLNGAVNGFFADRIIAVSPANAQNLMESGVREHRITVMMNGAESLTRAVEADCVDLRARLGIPEGCFTAGIFARLEPYKGHRLLLEAARELKDEGRDFRFLICGKGPSEEEILDSIRELELQDRVLFLGFASDVARMLSILDIQLNCSCGTEASSLALIEGMSLGLATVASDYGGNPWQVDDGVTGLLFRTGDARDLAQKLRTLMDDPVRTAAMGIAARKAYESRFTGEIFAANLEQVYDDILKKKGGSPR